MFVRTKTIRNRKYAYLVKNTWTKDGPRQKSIKYLGAVYVPEKVRDQPFETASIKGCTGREITEKLVVWQLLNHGFRQDGGVWERDGASVDMKKLVCSHAIMLNSDYLCTYTMRKLMRFKSSGDEHVVGLALAKAFVAAGIPLPKETFVTVFGKVYGQGQSFMR